MNDCRTVQPRLEDYRVDLLDAGQKRSVEAHLASCPRCDAVLAEIRSLEDALIQAAGMDCGLAKETIDAGLARLRTPRTRKWKERIPMIAAAAALVGTFIGLLAAPPGPAPAGPQEPRGIFEEKQLGVLQSPDHSVRIVWSPDGKTWAYKSVSNRKAVIDIGGKRSEEWDDAGDACFSPDGKSVAYVARKDKKEFVVAGNERGEAFDRIWLMRSTKTLRTQGFFQSERAVLWAPDSHAFAYQAENGPEKFVVVGTRKSGPYMDVHELRWSPDGRTVAFSARINEEYFVVVDDRRGEIFDYISNLTFSPDGKTVAYRAMEGPVSFIMVGDRRQPSPGHVGAPVFGPDGKNVAYPAGTTAATLTSIYVNGVPDPRFPPEPDRRLDSPIFSPDGKRLAVRALAGGRESLLLDGKPYGESFDKVGDPLFGPDGATAAYVAMRGNKQLVVFGRDAGEKFSQVDALTFSPDGKSVAYRAERFGKHVVVAGKALSEEYDAVLSGPFYSPDSKKVAFAVRKGMELWSKVMEVR